MEIKSSVAVVTGGGGGIGESIVKYLARQGAKAVVVDKSQDQLARVVADVIATGGDAVGVQADVTSETDTARFVQTAIDTYGKVNIAVACAGIVKDGTMLSLDRQTGRVSKKMGLDKWQPVIDVNLTGTFLTIRDSAEAMVNGGWPGLLVVISSVNKMGQVGQLNYSSTKAAEALLPKIVIGEFLLRGIRNIRCVGIAPGYTATPTLAAMYRDSLEAIVKNIHIGRLVEPEEIARTIGHCIENEAINATTIEVTGGLCYPGGIAK